MGMTIEQLEARRAELVNKLQGALLQKKQAKALVSQLQGALMLTDEFLATMREQGSLEKP